MRGMGDVEVNLKLRAPRISRGIGLTAFGSGCFSVPGFCQVPVPRRGVDSVYLLVRV